MKPLVRPWIALACGVFLAASLPFLLPAGQASDALAHSASGSVSEPGSGPDHLKEKTRTTIATNAAPALAGATTNAPAKRVYWDFFWKDWDGLHFEVTRKTLLSQRVSEVTNLHVVNLEETRIGGKIGGKSANSKFP